MKHREGEKEMTKYKKKITRVRDGRKREKKKRKAGLKIE
jgi:hypothetical protein